MKITVNKQNLHHIVNVVATIIPVRAHIAALSAVFLASKDGVLTAASTDITTFAVANCKCEGDDGAFGVPAALLLSRLSTFTGEDVEIDVAERATFVCGSARAVLSVIPATEFPQSNDVEGLDFKISAQELHDTLGRVAPSAAEESGAEKPVLQSVLFDFQGGALTLFATDGKQISFAKIIGFGATSLSIVPKKFIGYMLKLLDGCEGDVTVTLSDRAISIEAEYWALSGSLREGQYPNWRAAIPKCDGNEVVVNREALTNALRACVPFGVESGFTRIEVEGEVDWIKFNSGAGNECHEEIEAKCQPFKIAFEGRRMISLLSALRSPLATLKIHDVPDQPRAIVMRDDNFTGAITLLR